MALPLGFFNCWKIPIEFSSMSWNASIFYTIPYRLRMVMACSKYGQACSLKNVLPPFRGWRLGLIKWHQLWMTSLVLQVGVIDSTIARSSFIPAATRHQVFNLISLETFPISLTFKRSCLQPLSELRSKLNEVHSMDFVKTSTKIVFSVSQLKIFGRPHRSPTSCRSRICDTGTRSSIIMLPEI